MVSGRSGKLQTLELDTLETPGEDGSQMRKISKLALSEPKNQ